MSSSSPLGLYLHIPFCGSICSYCNFNRGLLDTGLKTRYVDALEREIREAADGTIADSIFFGGGTPSLLEPEEVARLIRACRESFALADHAEITLETNPETVTTERMVGYLDAGVARISLGVQSLQDDELARLGRTHSSRRAAEAIELARTAGVDNLSVDLMLWLPGQSFASWQSTVEGVITLAPDHVSLYLLELYPNAPLREAMARAQWSQTPDDEAADMYLWAMDRFDRAGLPQYEISNVARRGFASRHNLKYWQDGAWLGFGCGAHSTRGAQRTRKVSGTEDYIQRVSAGDDLEAERRTRSRLECLEDALFTGLRLTEGVDLETAGSRYGIDAWARFGDALAPHIAAGRAVRQGQRLRLTRDGMLVANDVMVVFV